MWYCIVWGGVHSNSRSTRDTRQRVARQWPRARHDNDGACMYAEIIPSEKTISHSYRSDETRHSFKVSSTQRALFNDSRSTVFQTNNKAQEWVSDWGSAKIAKLCVVTQEEDLSCCECCSCCLCFMLLLLRINNITTHVHAYWIDP